MRKGAASFVFGLLCVVLGASGAKAGQSIEIISPLGGQYYKAKAFQGNRAVVRAKFFCPSYEANGAVVDYRDYVVRFTRREDEWSFGKLAQRGGFGRCFVQHRFPPGNWTWQVRVAKDGSSSEESDFLVESGVRVGPLTLTRGYANRYMRIRLSDLFGGNWQYGFRKRTNCKYRVSRDRFRCSPITWYNGDLTFRGRGRVWLSYTTEAAYWNVAFRIRKTNGYCLARGGSMSTCSRIVVER